MRDFNMIEDAAPNAVIPKQKIKVFISSKCGDKGKYDNIRKELRVAIYTWGRFFCNSPHVTA